MSGMVSPRGWAFTTPFSGGTADIVLPWGLSKSGVTTSELQVVFFLWLVAAFKRVCVLCKEAQTLRVGGRVEALPCALDAIGACFPTVPQSSS